MKKFFLFLAIVAAGCTAAVFSGPPPSVGFMARVRPPRALICVAELTTPDQCDYVQAAAAKINKAVGKTLLKAPIVVHAEILTKFGESVPSTIVLVTALPDGVLGITQLRHPLADGTFGRIEVGLDPYIFRDDAMAQSVVLHELVHSLGADHAGSDWEPSVMLPAYSLGVPVDLTPADIAALKAAYR